MISMLTANLIVLVLDLVSVFVILSGLLGVIGLIVHSILVFTGDTHHSKKDESLVNITNLPRPQIVCVSYMNSRASHRGVDRSPPPFTGGRAATLYIMGQRECAFDQPHGKRL
jgi:hypothetical protein